MPAFPTRLTRSALGPRFQNSAPVENPETDIGEEQFNALFWATAGASMVVPRAVLIAGWNSGSSQFDIRHQAEAWNPDGGQSHPVLARSAAGIYTYTFASSYLNERDQATALSLVSARVASTAVLGGYSDRLEARAWIDFDDPLIVQIRMWATSGGGAGSGYDAAFWLDVF